MEKVKNLWKLTFLPGKPLKMNEILKILLFQDPYMPGIDLNLVCVNMEQFLKIDVVQPTANRNSMRKLVCYIVCPGTLQFLLG